MFVSKGDDSVHREQKALSQLRVRESADQMKQCEAGAHCYVHFQRLSSLMLVVAERQPTLLSDYRKPMNVERVRREVVLKPLNDVTARR